ncbi:molybdate ABC transporter substrate-binding protein [Exiguobacterium sp. SH1S21]|uniref:molybdate ABC transporter substrate-binding protein n=1 Tax=Exiguobacterium sp. SH1S21 TaxID=2510953 RepID=UPI00103D7A89|nr:molybdate ABC transporter substrate-binding protein [Exiguobacterium sp. SH1S21]TCI52906.1 molybdate ABC transporter substrate-binding protein [Exiguobacterium sp. SH1S21]
MKRVSGVIVGVAVVLLLSQIWSSPSGAHDETVTILAAASLGPVLEQVERQLEAELGDVDIRVVTNGSGALRSQINHGSPADIFLAASEEDVDKLQVPVLDRDAFLKNELWFVTPKGKSCTGEWRELELCARIVIGDPVNVPAGRYAKMALDEAEVWGQVKSRIIFVQNVRQVLTLVEQGDANGGFVYKTELTEGVAAIQAVSLEATGIISYPAVRLTHGPYVRDVYERLFDDDIQAIFLAKGFSK